MRILTVAGLLVKFGRNFWREYEGRANPSYHQGTANQFTLFNREQSKVKFPFSCVPSVECWGIGVDKRKEKL